MSASVSIAHCDPIVSAGVAAILGEQGFTVLTVAPQSAPSNLSPADVVVADYESGLRLVDSLQVHSTRVMILTDRDSQASIIHALERGVRGYLLLGCSASDLVSGIRSVHSGSTALGPLVAARIAERVMQPALTGREEQVLKKIMSGLSNKAIASELLLKVGTVKAHVKSILKKLGAVSRTQAVMLAQRRGLVAEESDWPRRHRARDASPPRLPNARTAAGRGQPRLSPDADTLDGRHPESVPYGRCRRDLHVRIDHAQRQR